MKRDAFTLVEVMVATAIVVVLALLLTLTTHQTAEGESLARSTADEFRAAQHSFEAITEQLSRATLNSQREFRMEGKVPRGFEFASDLRFVSGPMQAGRAPLDGAEGSPDGIATKRPGHGVFFQAVLGRASDAGGPELSGRRQLLNTWGYFVEVGDDGLGQPSFLAHRSGRVAPRLVELREPADQMRVYAFTSGDPAYRGFEWFQTALTRRMFLRTVAPNIAVLLLRPKLPAVVSERVSPSLDRSGRDALLAPECYYTSAEDPVKVGDRELRTRHRLPPLIDVAMVALDNATVSRLYHANNLDPFSLDGHFLDASRLDRDLYLGPSNSENNSLERRLISMRARYRIFTTTVALRTSQ